MADPVVPKKRAPRKRAPKVAVPVPQVIASFQGYFKGFSIDERTGELVLKVGVPLEFKRDCMPFTDLPGMMAAIVVAMIPRERRRASSEES